MLFSSEEAPNMRILPLGPEGQLPTRELRAVIQEVLRKRKQSRVAVMAGENTLDRLSNFDFERLDPEEDYRWSGWLVQKKARKPAKRVIAGTYDQWFQWYMTSQRFRAFHTIVLIDPVTAVSEKEHGGYIDGLLARLMSKVSHVVIVSEPAVEANPVSDEPRAREALRALLYGTRMSKPALFEQARLTFLPIPEQTLVKGLAKLGLNLTKDHTRYQLDTLNERLLQGMVSKTPPSSEEGEPGHIEQLFRRKKRFRAEAKIPDKMLSVRAMEDVANRTWVTVPYETEKLANWLSELNQRGDPRIREIYDLNEDISDDQWVALLAPTRKQVRRILDGLVAEGKLTRRTWYREVGRPAFAYVPSGKVAFLERRCGQCAFYASAKRRCNLWWLANQTTPFFYPRWRQTGSQVEEFEIHKMRFASRIGPHSSACSRFLDKKRDHLRKAIPERCEMCGEAILPTTRLVVTCLNCATRYVHSRGRVRVMTAYEHEFNRIYHEATGGDAKADYEEHRRKAKENLRIRQAGMPVAEDLDDFLAEQVLETELEPPRVWPGYSPSLQEEVDQLSQTTDLAKRLSIAMGQSALNATRRIIDFVNLYRGDADPLVAQQEKYLALINEANQSKLLPYEAQIMRQYWLGYGLALKRTQQVWFGPRKKSRYVTEFVEDPAGRARGYSPVDAAINYLHQRRLRQAERANREVGFPGTCDGFLHRERYNSRKIGLLLDMIDPFKFADREELLLVFIDQGMTWKDFKIETDRRGSTFYHPTNAATSKLDQVGLGADNLVFRYVDKDMRLSEAYRRFAESMLHVVGARAGEAGLFIPFIFGLPAEAQ